MQALAFGHSGHSVSISINCIFEEKALCGSTEDKSFAYSSRLLDAGMAFRPLRSSVDGSSVITSTGSALQSVAGHSTLDAEPIPKSGAKDIWQAVKHGRKLGKLSRTMLLAAARTAPEIICRFALVGRK